MDTCFNNTVAQEVFYKKLRDALAKLLEYYPKKNNVEWSEYSRNAKLADTLWEEYVNACNLARTEYTNACKASEDEWGKNSL